MPIDNLSVDKHGAVWGAGFPKAKELAAYFDNPATPAASSALRFTLNTGRSAFFGEKYKVDKVIESDGTKVASGSTSIVHDADRGRLFFGGTWSYPFLCFNKVLILRTGLIASGITICDLPAEK